MSGSAEIERPGDVELLHRGAVVEQHQELDLGRAHAGFRGLDVGFELNALQLQAVQVHAGDVAGLETVAAHGQQAVVVGQALAGHCQHRLGLERRDEGAAQVEEQVALLVGQLRDGHGGALLRAFQAQFALVCPLVQIVGGDVRKGGAEGAVRVAGEGIELIDADGHVGIGPQVGGDLLGLGFVDADLAGAQGRVGRLELGPHLRPGQGLLRKNGVGQRARDEKPPTAPQYGSHFTS